jgi:hypothetical protein
MSDTFGDFIFYADESGDHSLSSVDITFPVFALSLCGFQKSTYCKATIPRFLNFKFRYFGHDSVVLHEREIRKQIGPFAILTDVALRSRFMDDLTDILSESKFRIFASVIDKHALKLDMFPTNPYSIALRICLQSAHRFLSRRSRPGCIHHFVFEKRGPKEDADLELEFRRIVDGENEFRKPLSGFQIHFSDKRTNSTGMQIADLTARPLGLKIMRPNQPNRAYGTIEGKIFSCKKFGKPSRGIYAL